MNLLAPAVPAVVPARPRRRPGLLDVTLAVVTGGSLLLAILASTAGTSPPAPWTGVATVAAVTVAAALFRVAPVVGLAVGVAAIGGYHALGGPSVGLAWPLALPLYGVARLGYLRPGAALASIHLTGMLLYQLGTGTEDVTTVLHGVAQEALLIAAALLVGEVVRNRAGQAADAESRLALERSRHVEETERRVAEERLRIAHDVHDVTAHTVSIIALHAGVASERFGSDPDGARAAIETIRRTSQQASRDLRSVVGLLRAGADASTGGSSAVLDSVERARSTGLSVDLTVTVAEAELDGATGIAVARVVQECLTNTLRHARASSARIVIATDADELVVEATDDGVGPAPAGAHAPGVGLRGMRERIEMLGGSVTWGAARPRGFEVVARLPRIARP